MERLRRTAHMAAEVPTGELEARNTDLIETYLEEGLSVVGAVTADRLARRLDDWPDRSRTRWAGCSAVAYRSAARVAT